MIKNLFKSLINLHRPKVQIKLIRGRWCSVNKIRPTVYKVSVIDRVGNFVGVRFITPGFRFERELDSAVHSLLLSHASY